MVCHFLVLSISGYLRAEKVIIAAIEKNAGNKTRLIHEIQNDCNFIIELKDNCGIF